MGVLAPTVAATPAPTKLALVPDPIDAVHRLSENNSTLTVSALAVPITTGVVVLPGELGEKLLKPGTDVGAIESCT